MKDWLKGLLAAIARFFKRIWELIVGTEEPECARCGRPLKPDATGCPHCARREEEEKEELKPLVLRPLGRGQENPARLAADRPRLAIDLGTSASAVAFMEPEGEDGEVLLVDFGRLGEGGDPFGPAPARSQLIGSEIFDGSTAAGEKITCLGRTAMKLHREDPARGRYHTSVKRALEAHTLKDRKLGSSGLNPHLMANLKGLVVDVFTELLLLAVLPDKSATWRSAVELEGDDRERFRGVGLPLQIRPAIADWIRHAGVELYITVPNSFSRHELEVLRNGADTAARALFDALGAPPDNPIRIHTPREAEAIAWWEQHARRIRADSEAEQTEEGTERWLVFDMGAGTTDLALVEVRDGDIRLIRRSGVPLGGDDVDLTLLLYLVHGDLRDVARSRLMEGSDARLQDLDVSFGSVSTVGLTPEKAADLADAIDPEIRQDVKREARVIKEAWSGFVPPTVEDDLAEWVASVIDLAPVEGRSFGDLSGDALLTAPFWADRYRLFVHLVTVGCCRPLVEEGVANQQVDRVLLSGRATFLPGIEACLKAALAEVGLYEESRQCSWPSPPLGLRVDAPMDAKLAVVRGAAVLSNLGQQRLTPARMADAITADVRFGGGRAEVFAVIPRNTQLDARGQCRRLYRLTERPGTEVRIGIHRRRIPREVVDAVDRSMRDRLGGRRIASTRLCRRPLAYLSLGMESASEYWLGFQVDEHNSRVDLFTSEEGDELTRTGKKLVGLPADPTNPVTALHSDWLWGGRLR